MNLLEKYYHRSTLNISNNENILFRILDDITDRSGLQNAWDGIDEDIQNEILETWLDIIED